MNSSTRYHKSEVDLRVSQELKNHQDFIYQTNQTLQNLSERISYWSLAHEKGLGKSGSDHKSLLIEFEKFTDSMLFRYNEIAKKIGDIDVKTSKAVAACAQLRTEITELYQTRQEFSKTIDPLAKRIDQAEKQTELSHDYFNQAVHALKANLSDQIFAFKALLPPKPSGDDPVKRQLEDKIMLLRADIEGLITEIARLKKAVIYDEKKFEAIFTRLDRIQERGSLSHKKE